MWDTPDMEVKEVKKICDIWLAIYFDRPVNNMLYE